MSEPTKSRMRMLNGAFWVVLLGVAAYLIVRNIAVVSNVLLVLLGFGAVVIVHEFGHFLVAKLSGIKVEAFSIFMPPTLLGIRRTKAGFKLRFLPSLYARKEEGQAEEPMEETEYRLGIFPFGGYVKLLGQEDTGPAKQVEDPRSFARKPVSIRSAVIAAGVTFNVISAAIIFMVVFLVGISLAPAVVGYVLPESPAAKAGLRPGDEVLEIGNKTQDLDFSDIVIAGALSRKDEQVPVTVRHSDGQVERIKLVAEKVPGGQFRDFGIMPPQSLTIAAVAEPKVLQERTGLLPGDRIVAANGQEVNHYWKFADIVRQTLAPTIQITAERQTGGPGAEQVHTELPLDWTAADSGEVASEQDLHQICSMVPRLRVLAVEGEAKRSVPTETQAEETSRLQAGDVIVAAGEVNDPTYKELRDITAQYENKPLPLQVLRNDANGMEHSVTVTVKPRYSAQGERVVIGFLPALDAGHAIVAKTIAIEGGPPALDIPRGAQITTVNGEPVSSFYDVAEKIRRWDGRPVVLEYRLPDGSTGGVTLPAVRPPKAITVESYVPEGLIPFKSLERLYQADSPLRALGMGYRRTWTFIAQTYITLKRLVSGLISPKNLMGPVGIITVSYHIVSQQPLVNYAYFLGLISATIAVVNFLPIPPFDGGLIVLMLIEKVKGSALTERTQGIVAYAGWVLVLILLVYVTFNDIVRSFFS
jgi:regulator of sigma E protease